MCPKIKSTTVNNPLGEFLSNIAHERNLSFRAIAAGSGVSHAYLSEIVSGKKTPEAGVCNALADFLEFPRTKIYKLAGWLDLNEEQEFIAAIQEFVQKHPEMEEFLSMVMNIDDDEQRNAMLRLIRAGLGK